MPWVRIDENAMDHPKFLALSDGAWRLWVEGLAYCQKHLTNGTIPVVALSGFRYFSTTKMKSLLAPYEDGANALWSQQDAKTVLVHDYLQWNDSKQTVVQARQLAQERRHRYNDRRAHQDASLDANGTRTATANVSSGVGTSVSSLPERSVSKANGSDALSERAGRFCERYADMHEKFRKGAKLVKAPAFRSALGAGNMDYQEALTLVSTWDDARLDVLAEAFLKTEDDAWIDSGPRTLARFRSRASWCDERLRDYDARKGMVGNERDGASPTHSGVRRSGQG